MLKYRAFVRDYDGSIREIHIPNKDILTNIERAKITGEKIEEIDKNPDKILVPAQKMIMKEKHFDKTKDNDSSMIEDDANNVSMTPLNKEIISHIEEPEEEEKEEDIDSMVSLSHNRSPRDVDANQHSPSLDHS